VGPAQDLLVLAHQAENRFDTRIHDLGQGDHADCTQRQRDECYSYLGDGIESLRFIVQNLHNFCRFVSGAGQLFYATSPG